MTVLPQVHQHLHGAVVSYGLVVQSCLEKNEEELGRLIPFFSKLGLPLILVASIWSAYYYLFALCGAALAIGVLLGYPIALLLAGLWGNLLDRGSLGFVVDFIDLGWWPVFNIADSAITVGVALYLLEQWRKSRSTKNSHVKRK